MSETENEVRESKGKDPDFPWKNESMEGIDKEAEKEHETGMNRTSPRVTSSRGARLGIRLAAGPPRPPESPEGTEPGPDDKVADSAGDGRKTAEEQED